MFLPDDGHVVYCCEGDDVDDVDDDDDDDEVDDDAMLLMMMATGFRDGRSTRSRIGTCGAVVSTCMQSRRALHTESHWHTRRRGEHLHAKQTGAPHRVALGTRRRPTRRSELPAPNVW